MDLLLLGKEKISEQAPAGADVRHDPAFEALQGEIGKMSHPCASGTLDWARVNSLAARILAEKSKDLLVAGYLAVAQIHMNGIQGFAAGLCIYHDLIEHFWEDLFPAKMRMRARVAAIEWWLEKCAAALLSVKVNPLPAGEVEQYRQHIVEIDKLLRAKLDNAPLLRPLERFVESLPIKAEAILVAEAATGEKTTLFVQTAAQPTATSACPPAPPKSPSAVPPKAGRGWLQRFGRLFSKDTEREQSPRMEGQGSRDFDLDRMHEPADTHVVQLGASAPSTIRPGDEFSARFVAYLKEQEAQVKEMLHWLSPRATSYLGIQRCRWRSGTRVTVRLSGRWLEVQEAEQTFTWEAPHVILDFDAVVSPHAPHGTTILKFDAFIDGIRVAKLRIDLEIAGATGFKRAKTVTTEAAVTAFASYCSQDRQRVLDRLASVRISAGLEVFLDCLSLRPGEEWKPTIAREILSRDQFLLFWSRAAAQSKWVTWEWQTALVEKGRQDMQIHPLENNVPPPAELSDLHFGDVFMAVRDAY